MVDNGSNNLLPISKKTRSAVNAKFNRIEAECLLCPSFRGYSKDSGNDWTKNKKNGKLIKASTDDIDATFRNSATIINDTALAAELETASDVHDCYGCFLSHVMFSGFLS